VRANEATLHTMVAIANLPAQEPKRINGHARHDHQS